MAIKLSGLVSNMDTDTIVKELMSAQRLKSTKLENKVTTTEWKQDIWKALNTKLYSFYTGTLSKAKLQGSYNTKAASSSDEGNATVTASASAPAGTHTLKISQLASSQNVTGAAVTGISGSTKLTSLGYTAGTDTISVKVGSTTTTLKIDDKTTVSSFVSKLKNAGLNASFDTTQKRFFISSKQSGSSNVFSLDSTKADSLAKLGLNKIDTSSGKPVASGTADMNLIAPKDAKFEYNGVGMTSTANTVSINGLSLTLKSITNGSDTSETSDDEIVNLNVTADKDAAYKMVKSFLTEYNDILKQMNTYYNATPAKGYDPLTDEQKDAMSDDEVEKWETKIKDSLLRRDGNLNTLISTMRSSMSGNVEVDGKNYALSSFGIGTALYTENGLLHIDGDSEDSITSGEDDKLKKALEQDPDKVAKVLSGLASDLYDKFFKEMKSSTLRSALTLYDDKQMKKQVDGYKDTLSTMEDKLEDMESRYYKQFSAMETAMSKMNSQSSSLTSLLGKM
jgi:flagellar hook-associated protein 2